jgi:hypothetical protein
MTAVSGQRLDKHVPAATNTYATIVTVVNGVFLRGPCRDVIRKGQSQPVERGLNTSTVTLRVVWGYEKGSLKTETVKYGREYQGTRTRERLRWRGPAAHTKDRPVLSSERYPHKNKTVTAKTVINIWTWAPSDLLTVAMQLWLWLKLGSFS